MDIKVLYHVEYFERDLFLLQIDNKTTMVYRRSGLHGKNTKGEILPFNWLKDSPVRFGEAREGIVPGYIFKEFFYRGVYKSHRKNLNDFPSQIMLFVKELEIFLRDYDVSTSEKYNGEDDFGNILKIAKDINTKMKEKMRGLDKFDWYSLAFKKS